MSLTENAYTESRKQKAPSEDEAKCMILLVGRDRFELSTYGLRVRCSTS